MDLYWMIFSLLGCVVAAIIPATIAEGKGRSFKAWWIYGFFLFLPALIHSLLIRRRKNCIDCAESMLAAARVCSFCGKEQWKRTPE